MEKNEMWKNRYTEIHIWPIKKLLTLSPQGPNKNAGKWWNIFSYSPSAMDIFEVLANSETLAYIFDVNAKDFNELQTLPG